MSNFYGDYEDPPDSRAVFDYAPSGALMLWHPKDAAFTALLRQAVPVGFLTWSTKPFCWVIDADYAKDALDLAYKFFDEVESGTID